MAAVLAVVREEGSNNEALVNFSTRKTSAEKGIIQVHLKRSAARPAAAILFHASENIVQNFVSRFVDPDVSEPNMLLSCDTEP